MAVTLAAVRSGLQDASLKFREIDSNTIAVSMVGNHTELVVVIRLEENGEYLSMRTIGYATCESEFSKLPAVITELTAANEKYALVSFGWDKSDGEIVGEVSLPLEDNSVLTSEQINTLFGHLILACDQVFEKLKPLIGGQETHVSRRQSDRSSNSGKPAPSSKAANPSAPKPASVVMAVGVLLVGVAAVGGVIWLFIH